jgi:hypothetical protein
MHTQIVALYEIALTNALRKRNEIACDGGAAMRIEPHVRHAGKVEIRAFRQPLI